MIHHTFAAMGTTVVAAVADAEAGERLAGWFATVEARLSRFVPTSELERLNRADAEEIELSGLMTEVMEAAVRVRGLTTGLVDVAVGASVRNWGYDATFADVTGRPHAPPPCPPPEDWWLAGRTLHRPIGTLLDLGGVAKGWAADKAVAAGHAVMVSVGGDTRSAHPDTVIDVVDAADRTVARVPLGQGALATSSTLYRRWKAGDRIAHHLIDPRTGDPAVSPVVQATVVAGDAVDAEAGAKAVILLGAAGLVWADRQPWIRGAISIWHDGAVYATTGLEVAA